MLATFRHDLKTHVVPYASRVARKVRHTIVENASFVYLLLLCVGAMMLYLSAYKGVVKNYCQEDTHCHYRFKFYASVGFYCFVPLTVYMIVMSMRSPVALTLFLVSGSLGYMYMKDAWRVKLDGTVLQDTEWTLCRLLQKYAPNHPTKSERGLFMLPILSLIMVLCMVYLFSSIGLQSTEMHYFVAYNLVLIYVIVYSTYILVKTK